MCRVDYLKHVVPNCRLALRAEMPNLSFGAPRVSSVRTARGMSDPATPAEPAEDGAPAPPLEDAGDPTSSAPATEPGDETTDDVPDPTDSATEANGDEDESAAESPAADGDAAVESPEDDTKSLEASAAEEKEKDDADATAGADPATTADVDPGDDAAAAAEGEPEARAPASSETDTTGAEVEAALDDEAGEEAGDAEKAHPPGDAEAPDAAVSDVSGEESDDLPVGDDVFSDGDGSSSSSPRLASRHIEGFDDDFRGAEGDSRSSSDDDAAVEGLRGLTLREEEREDFVDPVEQLDALVKRTALERDALRAETAALEVRVATALAKKRGEKVTRGGASPSLQSSEEAKEDEAEFTASLTRWREMTSLRDARAAAFDLERSELTARLRDASAEADAARAAFVDRLSATAKAAQHEKTGKALAAAAARRRLAEERDAEASLSRARLALIESTRARAALERRVREKEHLAEGLKLIDFEQLKMETVALKEKFQERAGDYEKIKRKTSDITQLLTHAKEKLRFTREENRELTEEMARVDRQSKAKGDIMQRLKDEIAAFKKETEAMQNEAATVTDPTLLDDYEDKKRDAREAKARLAEVAAELEAMALETTNAGRDGMKRAGSKANAKLRAVAPGKPSAAASAAARRAAGAATPFLEL